MAWRSRDGTAGSAANKSKCCERVKLYSSIWFGLLLQVLRIPGCDAQLSACCLNSRAQPLEGAYGLYTYTCPTHHDIDNVVIFADFALCPACSGDEQPKLTCTVRLDLSERQIFILRARSFTTHHSCGNFHGVADRKQA